MKSVEMRDTIASSAAKWLWKLSEDIEEDAGK